MSKTLLPMGSDWTFEKIDLFDKHISELAHDWMGLDTYPNQIEVISAEQMLDAYSSVGMPVNYNHWSFGKSFIENRTRYMKGQMGLAYEIVLNSNPCIAYLMEENTMPMQALVIAHASYGHNAVFKNNYLFKQFTDAEAILDYLVYARDYIRDCEERYGFEAVEQILDAAHSLQNYAVDQYTKPEKLTASQQAKADTESREYAQRQRNELWDTTIPKKKLVEIKENGFFPKEPEDNFLYFFEKYSPVLEPWQREILRIVRKKAQYFYPQRLTKTLNEGFATFTHYHILQKMSDEKMIDESFMLEILHSHTSVVQQPGFDSPYYSGINPYALGFSMFQDIKRICETPTPEDEKWFPNLVGKDWMKETQYAMANFKDESFISQYLSPKLIREFSLFRVADSATDDHVTITDIHNEDGYANVIHSLSDQYNLSRGIEQLSILDANIKTDRTLLIQHRMLDNKFLSLKTLGQMFHHIHTLWGFPIEIVGINDTGDVLEHHSSSAYGNVKSN